MNITIHQTHHIIADFNKIYQYLDKLLTNVDEGIHVFPELFLTGYPLQDLCLQKPFVDKYQQFLIQIEELFKKTKLDNQTCFLIGGLKYELTENGIPKKIENVVYQYDSKCIQKDIYTKRLLPNYDIFDEQKYFSAGKNSCVIEFQGKKFGILICEDMWKSSFHEIDPVMELKDYCSEKILELDGILNLSASPYILDKQKSRIDRAVEISHFFNCPFIYVNRIGGEDDILFDGQSFVVNLDEVTFQAKRFLPQTQTISLPDKKISKKDQKNLKHAVTWEELFKAQINHAHQPAKIDPWTDSQCAEVLEALAFGFQEYARKNGFQKFTIALSGGMDSALVLTIIRLCLRPEQKLEAIYMPSIHSSSLSYDLSFDLCQKLGINLTTLPIKFLHSTAKNLFGQSFSDPFEGLTDENIQSRLRGVLLYARSNQFGSMVVNTSNKSELAVGYSTQYGDSVGAISMLGDLYKSQIYRLAEYINHQYDLIIPEKIITREPTAELREGQIDTDSLPPYEVLDAILEGILSYRYKEEDLLELGFSKEDVKKTLNMYRRNEYKRYQFCPIIKISSKSFGFGYRIPLSKNSDFYHQL